MVAALALLLAVVHALVAVRYQGRAAHGIFSVLSLGVAAMAAMELLMMKQSDPAVFGELARRAHLPSTLIAITLPVYLRLRLGKKHTGWFAAAVGSRLLAAGLNFSGPVNLAWHEVRSLEAIDFLGSKAWVANEVVPNPLRWVGAVSLLLLAIYVFAIWISHLRIHRDKTSLILAAGYISWVVLAIGSTVMINFHVVRFPFVISISMLPLLGCIAWELSRDILRVAAMASRLEEQTADMEMAARVARIAHWNWDMEQGIIRAGGMGREIYGMDGNGNTSFGEFMASVLEEDRPIVEGAIAGARSTGWLHAEYRLRDTGRTGQAAWVLACGRVEFDGSGRARRMRGLSMDISQRKAAESEARERREEVARLSRVGALGEISGSLAHELNQPLSAILHNAETARRLLEREPPETGEALEACSDVVSSTLRAREVVQRLRALLERGESRHTRLDADGLITEVLELLGSELRERGINVEVIPGVAAEIHGDRVQLQQVLLNLFLNAAEAMQDQPAKDRRLEIVTRGGDHRIEILVTDSGRGLPDLADDIFDPFVTTKAHGLGMGLAVCRTITRAHGGNITAFPNPGRGTTFRVEFPRATPRNPSP